MSVRKTFIQELNELHTDMVTMCELVENAIESSISALINQDTELALKIVNDDTRIDELEKSVESKALHLFLAQQPVADDLRNISTALKIITDMERIGDQAADIAEISTHFKGKTFVKELEHIPQMAQAAVMMVRESVKAYIENDIILAGKIINDDCIIDNLFDQIKRDLAELIISKRDEIDQIIDLLLIAKYFERIGDHSTNIAEWVIFNVTGVHKNKRIF